MENNVEHSRIIDLLPWHLSGALSTDEAARVEAHLADCANCQREIETLKALQSAVVDSNEEMPPPSPRLRSRVTDRVDEYEEERSRPPMKKLFARLRAWGFASPRFALAQLLVLITLASALGVFMARSGHYQSLFDQEKQRANLNEELFMEERKKLKTLAGNISQGKTARINVAFQERATEKAIRELLTGLKADIAHGPSDLGIYIIAVPVSGQDNRATVESAADRLRSRPDIVRFAEAQPD